MLTCAEISLTIPYHAVNGRLDLVNLFPVKLDLKPFIDAWGNAATFRISAPDGSLHFCGVDVAPSAAGTIQTNDVYTTTGDPLYAADFVEMQQGEAQIAPVDYLGNNNAPGLLAFEAVEAYGKPKLSVLLGETSVLEFELPLSLSSVRDMYRWRNLRPVCNGSYADWDAIGVPSNMPDGETNGKDVFFLHGFNVSEVDARNWANQVFKRLWLSGLRARFHGIAWYGDYNWGGSAFNGLICLRSAMSGRCGTLHGFSVTFSRLPSRATANMTRTRRRTSGGYGCSATRASANSPTRLRQ